MAHILIFGDSIAYGAWDREGGWVQRLRKFLDEKTLAPNSDYCCFVYNLGVPGDTTGELLKRIEQETKQRQDPTEETIFIFAIGINDSQLIRKKNKLRYSPGKFKKNLENIVAKARQFSSKIVFIGLNPVDESKVNPMPWAMDKAYQNKHIEKFDGIIKSVCAENNLLFVDILPELKKIDYTKLLEDGAHPNTKGHQKIFNLIKTFLVDEKIV